MQSAVRKIHFCYGHRVMNHESKCGTLHGHNGILWIYVTPIDDLDSLGRVIDFSVVKSVIGDWILENWDHTMIIFKEDLKTIEDWFNHTPRQCLLGKTPYEVSIEKECGMMVESLEINLPTLRIWG